MKNSIFAVLAIGILIFSTAALDVSADVDASFNDFDMTFNPGLVFSTIELQTDKILLDGRELYEDSTTSHDFDLKHYNTSLKEVMRLDYSTTGDSTIVWNLTGIPESDENLFVKDENGNVVYEEKNDIGLESMNISPETDNTVFKFYVASGDVNIIWDHDGNATGYRVYRNVSTSPSIDVKTGDWNRVLDIDASEYDSESGGTYTFNKTDITDPGETYCYRVTAYNVAGESSAKPDDAEGACISQ